MEQWQVTTERLRSSANVIEEKTSKYETEWQKLYTEVQNLRADSWKGVASDTFNNQLEGYRNDFENMAKILREYAECLKNEADLYEKKEGDITNGAGNLSTGR